MDKQYNSDGFIPKQGGYERLITYQKAEIIDIGKRIFTRRRTTGTNVASKD